MLPHKLHIRKCLFVLCALSSLLALFYYYLMFSPGELLKLHFGPFSSSSSQTIRENSRKQQKQTERAMFDEQILAQINERIWLAFLREQKQNRSRLECQRIISGDSAYTKLEASNRIVYRDPQELAMDCNSIRARNHFLNESLSAQERQFPFAYARNVYMDYRFLEAEFATNFHPQNWYCFAIDSKASTEFRKRVLALANCFDNVLIPKKELSVDGAGHSMGAAFMSCLRELAAQKRRWQYVFTLQNHDVQSKTNEESVQIFKWMGGANNIEFEFRHVGPQEMINGLQNKFNWTFKALNLFKDEKLNERRNSKGELLGMKLAKGVVQSALARPFVDFLVQKLNLTETMGHLDSWDYGADELFFQTLGSADHLNATNGFTHKCYDEKIDVPYIMRYSVWDYGDGRWENVGKCHSGITRHSICMLGVEDLVPNARDTKHVFLNKMMPSSDFSTIVCWHEEMRRRTLVDRGLHRLDAGFYQNWPQTRFHREWLKNGRIDIAKFNCSHNQPPPVK